MNYNFSKDYVSHFGSTWSKYLSKFKNLEDIVYLEIGVFEGRSLIWMLENILTNDKARAVTVDAASLFSPEWVEVSRVFKKNLEISGQKHKVQHFDNYSELTLPTLNHNFFNIIYIDGNHDADMVEKDLILSFPLLKSGGVLMIDDYLYEPTVTDNIKAPKAGVDNFLKHYGNNFVTLHIAYQIILEKK